MTWHGFSVSLISFLKRGIGGSPVILLFLLFAAAIIPARDIPPDTGFIPIDFPEVFLPKAKLPETDLPKVELPKINTSPVILPKGEYL